MIVESYSFMKEIIIFYTPLEPVVALAFMFFTQNLKHTIIISGIVMIIMLLYALVQITVHDTLDT